MSAENRNCMSEYDLAWSVFQFIYEKFPGEFDSPAYCDVILEHIMRAIRLDPVKGA